MLCCRTLVTVTLCYWDNAAFRGWLFLNREGCICIPTNIFVEQTTTPALQQNDRYYILNVIANITVTKQTSQASFPN